MKTIYMFLVRLWSSIFAGQRKTQITYLMSFGNNNEFVIKLAQRVAPLKLTIFYQTKIEKDAKELSELENAQLIKFDNGFSLFLKIIPTLMRSKLILIDNYFPFMGAIVKTKQMRVTQLWHANGAIKEFGFSDPSTSQRSLSAQSRFQKVYDATDDIVVGSQKMASIFRINYRLDGHQMRTLCYPRSDKFKNNEWMAQVRTQFFKSYPKLKDKRLILYAPTYRKDVQFSFAPNFENLKLPQNAVLILRLHPHLQDLEKYWEQKASFITSIDPKISTDELLTVADTLITDYSSILFDYTLLDNARHIGLFTFDQNKFKKTVGLQNDFSDEFHAIIISTVPQLSDFLVNPKDQTNIIKEINNNWNEFNDGKATDRTINFLMKRSEI